MRCGVVPGSCLEQVLEPRVKQRLVRLEAGGVQAFSPATESVLRRLGRVGRGGDCRSWAPTCGDDVPSVAPPRAGGMKRWWTGPHRGAVRRGDVAHNAPHVCALNFISGTLRLALAEAIRLTDLLRPHGRLSPHPARRAGLASDRKSGYQSGHETWVTSKTPNEINRIEPLCC